jgi:hypothetical protein
LDSHLLTFDGTARQRLMYGLYLWCEQTVPPSMSIVVGTMIWARSLTGCCRRVHAHLDGIRYNAEDQLCNPQMPSFGKFKVYSIRWGPSDQWIKE